MGQALYRKYRSKSLHEIVGQPHITKTLENALQKDAISHAYLFTGPRGVGKTSIARILAHEVNGLPYDDDSIHLDIIEIDAASNRRIDEIRELRERVHTAPTSAKYKVYIIDEVHMLTKEAFNALLKTLEEPPAHVIFILATTEAHKLPETIVSRTQRFTFKPVERSEVVDHLRYIATQEGADISDDALELIAEHGDGSFRDSISLLDQVRGQGPAVTLADVQTLLGIAPQQTLDELMNALQQHDPATLITLLQHMRERGYHAAQIAKQLAATLRNGLITGTGKLSVDTVPHVLQELLAVQASHDPESALEIALLNVVLHNNSEVPEPVTPAAKESPVIPPKPAPAPVKPSEQKQKTAEPVKKIATSPNPAPEPKAKKTSSPPGSVLDADTWTNALATIKQTHNTLYSVARMADAHIQDGELTLAFGFPFHQKRMNEPKNKQVIAEVMQKVLGKPVVIHCIVGESTPKKQTQAAKITPPASTAEKPGVISTISNIFGGAEVLES